MFNIITNGSTFLTIDCLYCDSFNCKSCTVLETATDTQTQRHYVYVTDEKMLNAQKLTDEKDFKLHEVFNEEMQILHLTDFYATEKGF